MAALGSGAMTIGTTLFGRNGSDAEPDRDLLSSIRNLQPLTEGVVPITVEERKKRIAKAQQLMEKEKMDAIFIEGTASCFYFTGMRWGQSERTFGVVIPVKGAIAYVCPKFEEDRARELIKPEFGDEANGSD